MIVATKIMIEYAIQIKHRPFTIAVTRKSPIGSFTIHENRLCSNAKESAHVEIVGFIAWFPCLRFLRRGELL